MRRRAVDLVVCRDLDERARLLDINRRLLPYSRASIVLILLAGLAGVSAYGWLPLAAMLGACVGYEAVQRRVAHLRRPELALVALLLVVQVVLAGGIALAHGPHLYLLGVMVFPLMMGAAVFPARTVYLVTVLSLLVLIGFALGFDAATALRLPPLLICPAIYLVTLPLLMEAACDVDTESRGTVVVDPLTGVLNRAALAPRLAELAHHVGTTGRPVALVVADLDRFKKVNDQYGHATGDETLKEVAYCLRKSLGPFQPIYRLGGEEFLIVLADTDAASASSVAERLREGIATGRVSRLKLTMSFGVADSSFDQGFDFEAAFKRADAALYEAKRAGRNCVRVAGAGAASDSHPPSASAPIDGPRQTALPGREFVAVQTAPGAPAPVEQPPAPHDKAQASDRSWLIPDMASRAHLLDLTQRLTRRTAGSYALGFATVLAAAPYYGWWILAPGFITGMIFNLVIANLERFRRPEYAIGLGALLAQAGGAYAFLLARGEILFDLPVLTLLLVGFSVVFPLRGVILGVLFTAAAMTAVAFLHGEEHQVIANPSLLVLPIALAATVGLIGSGVGRSDTEHRHLAVTDPLTGMLNRTALEAKIAAITHQASLTGEQVAIAVGDLDHFKAINDRHGHPTGDAVLAAAAQRIRSQLRGFDSAYRVGGEEFVVLLPGIGAADAASVAERIRLSVCELPIDGIPTTISLGVAASEPGQAFDYQAVFALADAALYDAKHEGRNRVQCHGAHYTEPETASAASHTPVAA